MTEPAPRRPLAFELALVVVVAIATLVPAIWSYSLVDPWETHYGEVGRMMLQDHDWVHMQWPGTNLSDAGNEGFRSKPVLTPWMIAAGLRTFGVAKDGGYSGEMVQDGRTMLGERLPFVLSAVMGLVLVWWMLARLVSRRVAWLSLLTVGSCPFFCLIARQAIPDMPLVATTMGALALFLLAMEDDHEILPFKQLRLGRRWLAVDGRHVVLGITGGFVLIQAIYYAIYFVRSPDLAIKGVVVSPALWIPAMMVAMLAALWREGFLLVRLPFLAVGGIIAAIKNTPVKPGARGGWARWIALLESWDPFALDRMIVRALVFPFVWASGQRWKDTQAVADRAFRMKPITRWRQLYLLACYSLLGVGVLAKGPPGLTVVGAVGVFYIVIMGKWRALYEGDFELKRGLLLMIVTFLPWHLAMYLKDGSVFITDYIGTHILNRATQDPDSSLGTFEYYTSQLGHGMWLWGALVPPALAAALLRVRRDTREGRVRLVIGLWAICGFAVFGLVTTKFHHYILPIVPALGVLVAFFLDDVWAKRDRMHLAWALVGAGIVLLVCRDLMWEPERWIEMFVFRYDRPWPTNAPWEIDVSDAFLALGVMGAFGLVLLATRWRRLGIAVTCVTGLSIGIWAQVVYMPIAGTHWGMREAARTYYEQRTIFGQKLVYFGGGQVADAWRDVGDTWSFETFVPDSLYVGQPMTITVEVHKVDDSGIEQTLVLLGQVTDIGDHRVTLKLGPGERKKLDPIIAKGGGRGNKAPVYTVDADRLIAYQLYWRGENYWSGEEVWGYLPEQKTSFPNTNNQMWNKYLADRARMPIGRRYFILCDPGRANSIKSMLPTARARDTYEILDETSNKFWLSAFYL
ncbi:MAG TPA: hypothetical protein VGM88_27100 [Kofleriaceae bacterium]|jgi:4-amino-4-deoxy-L-arabinose transferase-like glycosyltransferase